MRWHSLGQIQLVWFQFALEEQSGFGKDALPIAVERSQEREEELE